MTEEELAQFAAAVRTWIGGDDKRVRQAAEEFGCALSTVRRWATGVAQPGKNARRAILVWLERNS